VILSGVPNTPFPSQITTLGELVFHREHIAEWINTVRLMLKWPSDVERVWEAHFFQECCDNQDVRIDLVYQHLKTVLATLRYPCHANSSESFFQHMYEGI
jgi:hypothetical protein